MNERVDPQRVIKDAQEAGLRLVSRESFLRYQYMLIFERGTSEPHPKVASQSR
jgi:hypothetical protein